MRVLFVSSEVAPYSKTGGLADVAGALPASLRALGHEVVTITPLYSQIDAEAFNLTPHPDLGDRRLRIGDHVFAWSARFAADTSTIFIDIPELFDRKALYTDDPDEHLRFAALSVAALDACRDLSWKPHLIHCNDWQTGLIPFLVKTHQTKHFGAIATVFTIHNLGYQGWFPPATIADLGLSKLRKQLHTDNGYLCYLATGIVNATRVTTVSPTYAEEIQTPEGGVGLDALLQKTGVTGILNGIDTAEWNPRRDSLIPYRYSEKSLWRKEWNKRALMDRLGLGYRENIPVIGVVSRLVDQKGFDIVKDPLTYFLGTWDLRMVVLGNGEHRYESLFQWLATTYPDKVSFTRGYDYRLAHEIEAGADIFLMPSRYEPCGLNQMYSMAYGTAPVAHRVGGLADTVSHFDAEAGTGNGFAFDDHTPEGLGWALGRALALHTNRKDWKVLQRNAMAEDNSWQRRATAYTYLYERVTR